MNFIIDDIANNDEIVVEKNCKVISDKKSVSGWESVSTSESESEWESEIKKTKKTIKKPLNIIVKNKPVEKYSEYDDEEFIQKLGKFTFGLDKIIPWEDRNFIFSGGLLFDIITNRFSQDLMDIDLFFYGSTESKISTINKLLDNLDKNQYYYLIGNNRSVIYIFIQGVPRMIQLIMTDKKDPESIINVFDLSHTMSYTNGEKIYCSKDTFEYLNAETKFQKENTVKISCFHKNRIIKYMERGVLASKVIMDKYHFVLNYFDSNKYLMDKKQIKLYKLTYNLTRYPDGEQINFSKFDIEKIKFSDYFGCFVNYDKLDNHNFVEDIDMFGAFVQYMGIKKEDIIENVNDKETKINEEQSSRYISLNNYELEIYKRYGYGRLFLIEYEKSIYIPCNFILSELIKKDSNGNKVLKIKFEINNKSVIKYLTTKLNKYCLLDRLNSELIDKDLIKLKYKLDESKIYMPFDETTIKPDELEICSKIYNADIDDFYSLNDFGILDTLNKYEMVNCLFDIGIYLSVSNINNVKKIEYIDINLRPRYIFKKE